VSIHLMVVVLFSGMIVCVVSGKSGGKWKENNRDEQKGGCRVLALCSVQCVG